uniref:Ig-like domain-containing protein n=1 Tax=Gasterosteus aculeatus TaxID=69293 RepID=G3N4D5_GASAC
MIGCEWDDVTNEVKGYNQYGYDGEDFISFDLQTEQWIAPKQQAVLTKQKWDHDRALKAHDKNYLTHVCPEWLKKFLNYGRSSLMRTERPSVSLLQKTPSSPVSCHATGFYPHRAALFWRKDGEQLHEDVDLGEILPNHDGTFQMRVDLKLSSVPAEDWRRYDCVFQLSGVDEDIVTKLDKTRTNAEKPAGSTFIIIIIIIIAVVVLVVIIAAVVGFMVHRKRNAKCPS